MDPQTTWRASKLKAATTQVGLHLSEGCPQAHSTLIDTLLDQCQAGSPGPFSQGTTLGFLLALPSPVDSRILLSQCRENPLPNSCWSFTLPVGRCLCPIWSWTLPLPPMASLEYLLVRVRSLLTQEMGSLTYHNVLDYAQVHMSRLRMPWQTSYKLPWPLVPRVRLVHRRCRPSRVGGRPLHTISWEDRADAGQYCRQKEKLWNKTTLSPTSTSLQWNSEQVTLFYMLHFSYLQSELY